MLDYFCNQSQIDKVHAVGDFGKMRKKDQSGASSFFQSFEKGQGKGKAKTVDRETQHFIEETIFRCLIHIEKKEQGDLWFDTEIL